MRKKYLSPKYLIAIIVLVVILILSSVYIYDKYFKIYPNTFTEKKHLIDEQKVVDLSLKKILHSDKYTFEKPYVLLNPYGNAPLTAMILFQTTDLEKITLTVHGEDELTTFSKTFSDEKNHIIPVYGLYPDYNNKIVISNGQKEVVINIRTEKLPFDFPKSEVLEKIGDGIGNELIFTTGAPSIKYPAAFDNNGDVRWFLNQEHPVTNLKYLKNGNLMISSDRLMSKPYNMVGLYEMDLIGKVYNEFISDGGYHHDFYEMPNGDLLFLSDDRSKKTEHDLIVLMDRQTGKIKRRYELDKLLPMDSGKQQHWTEKSWFHANSIWYDEIDNSIIVSGRHQDIVVCLDFETGEIRFLLGDKTNWDQSMHKYFLTPTSGQFEWQYAQHSVTKEGNLVYIFDNGNNRSKIKSEYVTPNNNYSRAVIYEIDQKNMQIKQIFEYGRDYRGDYYSPYVSSFEKISPGNYLINYGGVYSILGQRLNAPAFMVGAKNQSSFIIEYKDGREVFKLNIKTNLARARKMHLYNSKFQFIEGKIIGEFKSEFDLNRKYDFEKAISKQETKYNFDISLEKDRIHFKTNTFSNSSVSFILKGKEKVITYSNYESNRFSSVVHLNIPRKDLSGVYKIYIQIDSTIYDVDYILDL